MIYLYYPAQVDAAFPNWSATGFNTNPLGAFDLSQLDGSIGTEAALLGRIETLVETGLCEFNLGVTTVNTMPTPLESRWQIIGIGSDEIPSPAAPIAVAQSMIDHNDGTPRDYARLWVGDLAEWAGAALMGLDSTLERWATGIANIIIHEAGHNHGTGHVHGTSPSHFMTPLDTNPATPQALVGGLRHHSDESYEALAHSVGLAAQTVINWDFVNPNGTPADELSITLVALQPGLNLTEGWVYSGPLSPWASAGIVYGSSQGSPLNFQGQPRDSFQVYFHNDKAWNNGPAGEIPAGAAFHVGLSVHGGPYAVYDAVLSYQGVPLPMRPRMVDFAGTSGFRPAPPARPGFSIRLTNPNPTRGPIIVRDMDVRFSPRMIDIDTMMTGAVPRGLDDRPAALYERTATRDRPEILGRAQLRRRQFVLGAEPVEVPIASFSDPRHLMTRSECPPASPESRPAPERRTPPPRRWVEDQAACRPGTSISLFPATYVYVSATIVDPAARHWDVRRRRMVTGPLASRVFWQVAGIVPDSNRNGVDDLLDIRSGRSRDRDRNGVPDESERRAEGGRSGR